MNTDEFEQWWQSLIEQQQIDLVASVELLEQMGLSCLVLIVTLSKVPGIQI